MAEPSKNQVHGNVVYTSLVMRAGLRWTSEVVAAGIVAA
jgi:hypothetical protein